MILLKGCYEKGLDEKRLYELGWDEMELREETEQEKARKKGTMR